MDMISSLSSGVTNVVKDVLGLSLIIISYPWMVKTLSVMSIDSTLLTYVLAFIALDFAGYWTHRVQHVVNFFWNGHIIHHSSEDFNLACALRQSISNVARLFVIFLLPAAILGVPANVISVVAPLHLFAQFWYHTEHIRKMGFLEKIIVTPSHHRVHHAINPEYLDKNFGQIFIIWDKLFGTYQEELDNVPAVYGITRPVQTWNPIKINFQHLWLMIKDAWRTSNWKDKFLLWFKPTGYRPADVVEKYPVHKIENVYNFEKYEPFASTAKRTWAWIQLFVILFFTSHLFANIALLNAADGSYIFIYGAFLFVTVYSLTDLMDGNFSAIIAEMIRFCFGGWILYSQSDWFEISNYSIIAPYIIGGYLCVSLFMSILLTREQKSLVIS